VTLVTCGAKLLWKTVLGSRSEPHAGLVRKATAGDSMTNKNGNDSVQQILELLDQQSKMLRKEKPMTEEEAQACLDRFLQIKELIERLSENSRRGEPVI
jgi:hypothetical protein